MRIFCLILCLTLMAGSAVAEDGVTYMRSRGHGGYGNFGGYDYFPPFYGNFFYPPPVYGSYYQRPYPTHLDYFRLRGMPLADCPCADPMPTPPEVLSTE